MTVWRGAAIWVLRVPAPVSKPGKGLGQKPLPSFAASSKLLAPSGQLLQDQFPGRGRIAGRELEQVDAFQ